MKSECTLERALRLKFMKMLAMFGSKMKGTFKDMDLDVNHFFSIKQLITDGFTDWAVRIWILWYL